MTKMKALISLTFALTIFISSASAISISDNDGVKASAETEMVTLKGKIIDSETKEPLAGVKISVSENSTAVYTDFDGNFEIKTSVDNKEVKVSYISYEETMLDLTKIDDNTIEINQIY